MVLAWPAAVPGSMYALELSIKLTLRSRPFRLPKLSVLLQQEHQQTGPDISPPAVYVSTCLLVLAALATRQNHSPEAL
jgi:hypothetical protein